MIDLQINEPEYLGYGEIDGRLIHISEAERGLNCNCNCPVCGNKLVAKKGASNTHHFAHYETNACEYSNETIIHMLGKWIIKQHMAVKTPAIEITKTDNDLSGKAHSLSFTDDAYKLIFREVELEKNANNFRPDITAHSQETTTHIEIVVTHDVSEEKLVKVREDGTPMMSIDLSQVDPLSTPEELKNIVIYTAPRKWVYHPQVEQIESNLTDELLLEITEANRCLKFKVEDHFQLEISNHTNNNTLELQAIGEVILFGYKSASGYSKKSKSDFDFSLLHIGKRIRNHSSFNFSMRACGGYELDNLSFDEALIDKLEHLNYPCIVRPTIERIYIDGRSREIVTAL